MMKMTITWSNTQDNSCKFCITGIYRKVNKRDENFFKTEVGKEKKENALGSAQELNL